VNLLSTGELFEHFQAYAIATGFALARMSGLIIVMPAFTRLGLTGTLKAATAIAFALPIVPMVVAAIASERLTVAIIAALLIKEVLIGLAIGLVLGIPIWAAEAAGDILDLQRGTTAASLFDPSSTTEESITGTLFGIIMVALYFGSGGLPLTLRTVYESYGIWPPGSIFPAVTVAAAQSFVALLDNVVTMGLMLVAPIVVVLLLTDLLLALVSRASPQFNVFSLSLNVKNLVFTLLLVLYGAFLITYMGTDLGSLLHAGSDLRTLANPDAR
jgi:type III secretion protein T